MARKKNEVSNTVMEAVITSKEEMLTPEDEAILAQESGFDIPTGDAPAETPAPEAEAKPAVEQPKPEEPKAEESEKKLSPAQERIQELVRERNELREKWARLEERQKLIAEERERQQQAEAERQRQEFEAAEAARRANERPDPSIDPIGAQVYDLRAENERLRQEFEAAKNQFTDVMNRNIVQSDAQRFEAALAQDVNTARTRHTDYDQAAAYATKARFDFWRQFVDENEAQRRVVAETYAIAGDAFKNNMSPGEVYYNLAKQWGYQGNTPAPAAPPAAQERLAQVAEGVKRQGFGGNTPNVSESESADLETLTPAQLASMSEDQFLNLLKDPKSAKILQNQIARMELG